MTPRARIAGVLELLAEMETISRPADAQARAFFRARRYIGSKDRAAISSLLYDTLRHKARLAWWADKLKIPQEPRKRLLIYLTLVAKHTPKEIKDLFDGTRYAPEPLTYDEGKLLSRLKGHTLFHPEMDEATQLECPMWAFPSLAKRFGRDLKGELEALLQSAPLDLRVNTLKIARGKALKELLKKELKVKETSFSPLGLRVYERPSLGEIALLKEGAIEIQDEGSQLVALLLDPKAGERIVDFCAGAGGKTLALSALMENKGRIVACDIAEKRLQKSIKRFNRADLHNIETKTLSSERDPWVKRHKEKFDRVLVDAPCSGTGTWRRNPDARWNGLGPSLDELISLQKSILESAARLVKKGGRLVYATCSLLPQENEEQIQRFLDNHPDFTLLPLKECKASYPSLPDTGAFLSLTPAKHDTDGFFAAVMTRSAPKPSDPEGK